MAERKIADQWLRDVLMVLFRRRTVTRAEIITETGLNPASVSHAMRLLLQHGTVLRVGDLESDGGRRREVFNLNGEAGYFVGVDLEGLRIRFALLNLLGDIRFRWEEDLQWGEPLDVDKLFNGIVRLLDHLDPGQITRVMAAGISYPGLLDSEGRLTAVNLGWHKFPLMAELRRKAKAHKLADLPFFLEPDRHSSVFAERWLGRAYGHDNGLLLFAERGIGIGLFLGGRPVEGSRNMAGEIGHLTVEPEAEDQCGCGKKGCLEAIASSPNIVRQYLDRTGRPGQIPALRVTDVFERARSKDAAALAVVERAGRAIGLALSHAVNLLNPEIVILGGDLVAGEDLLVPIIRDQLVQHALPELLNGLKLISSGLGPDLRLRGAGALAFRKTLADPVLLNKLCRPVLAQRRGAKLAK